MAMMISGRVTVAQEGTSGPLGGLRVEAWSRPSTLAHQSALTDLIHEHTFENAKPPLEISRGDILVTYIFLDPDNPPQEIMIQWNDGTWEHRAFWGEDLIDYGETGSVSQYFAGALPSVGQWVRLEVAAAAVGLEGSAVNGMAFTLVDGRATWDHAAKAPWLEATPGEDTVWVEDSLPPGAEPGGNEEWLWITEEPLPFSGPGQQALNGTVTDADGTFRIEVDERQFEELFAGRPPAIYFRVLRDDILLASTENSVVWRAQDLKMPVTIPLEWIAPLGPTEYERVSERIQSALNGRPLAELTGDEVTEVAQQTQVSQAQAQALWRAMRMTAESGLATEGFYALLRRDLPANLPELLVQPAEAWRMALHEAFQLRLIPERFESLVDALVGEFQRLAGLYLPLTNLADVIGLPPDDRYFKYLARRGIRRLADITQEGILPIRANPSEQELGAAGRLRALARLTLLPVEAGVRLRLLEAGYSSVEAIARTPLEMFVQQTGDLIGMDKAAALHRAAVAEWGYLNNVSADLHTRSTRGALQGVPVAITQAFSQPCECEDCRRADGPLAYLADLLDYAINRLTYNGAAVNLQWHENRYHQPFGKLPAQCSTLDTKIRQVRIAIEVLRAYRPADAQYSPGWYVQGAYERLLEGMGTSFDEMRRARNLVGDERWRLGQRLGIYDPTQTDPTQDNLAQLFREPGSATLTEEWLETYFGLRDSCRPAEDLHPLPIPTLASPMRPVLLNVQWEYLQRNWEQADRSTNGPLGSRPIIDPDVIREFDLKIVAPRNGPLPADRRQWNCWEFLQERRTQITTITTEIRNARQANGLEALLNSLQTNVWGYGATGMEGITKAVVLQQRRNREQRQDITPWLNQVQLGPEAFDVLSKIAQMDEDGEPVLSSEWEELYEIISGRAKSLVLFPIWRQEEDAAGITLRPQLFQSPAERASGTPAWQSRTWRSNWNDRLIWERTVTARFEQERALEDMLAANVESVEGALLAELRNELIRRAANPGVITPSFLTALSQRLQIDMQAGICQSTTRAAQAIETLQGVLFGTRNGLLEDPEIRLNAPHFDEEWRWIGSFEAWRAALQIFLHPELALRPTLRRRQSPAFEAMVQQWQTLPEVREADVYAAVAEYENYFQDIASLSLIACAAGSAPYPRTDGRAVTYLVAQGGYTQRYYWAYVDQSMSKAEAQSFWFPIRLPELETAQRVFGATCYQPRANESYLYLFFQAIEPGVQRILFTRRGLTGDFEWEAPRRLEPLPNNATSFVAARVRSTKRNLPPELSVWTTQRAGFARPMNRAGTAWEPVRGFTPIPLTGSWSHLGNQSRRFGSDFECSSSQRRAIMTAVGDFDNDGIDEIAIGNGATDATEANDIWVMKFNSSTGRWVHLSPVPGHVFQADLDCSAAPFRARFMVAGDFDGDGQDELAICAAMYQNTGPLSPGDSALREVVGSDSCFWVKKFNRATGRWFNFGRQSLVGGAPLPFDLAFRCQWHQFLVDRIIGWSAVVGDFNGDGRDEIAVLRAIPSGAGNEFWVMHLRGNLTWVNLPNGKCSDNENFPAKFAVAGDFDGNGFVEIAFGKRGPDPTTSNDFWVMGMNANGAWERRPGFDCSGDQIAARYAVAADVDGDGKPEIVVAKEVADSRGNDFWVAKMQPAGDWAFLPEISCSIDPIASRSAVAGDFDGDGADELAITADLNYPDNRVWIADLNSLTNNWDISEPRTLRLVDPIIRGVAGRFIPLNSSFEQWVARLPQSDNCFYAFSYQPHFDAAWERVCEIDEFGLDFDPPAPILVEAAAAKIDMLNQRAMTAIAAGVVMRRSNRTYLEELLHDIPLEAAIRLRESGEYRAALDWFRLVYDYGRPEQVRSISFKLLLDQQGTISKAPRGVDWLLDPLNPHAIAELRPESHTRFVLLSIVGCLLDYADREFTAFTAQSVPRGRELYEEARELLQVSFLQQGTNACRLRIGALTLNVGDDEDYFEPMQRIRRRLSGIHYAGQLVATADRIQVLFNQDLPPAEKLARADAIITAALAGADQPNLDGVLRQNRDQWNQVEMALLADVPVRRIAYAFASAAIGTNRSIFATMTDPSASAIVNEVFDLYPVGDVFETLNDPEPTPQPSFVFCVPPNPLVSLLLSYADLNLYKIRSCRTIAGLPASPAPYEMQTLRSGSLQNISDLGRMPDFTSTQLPPLPYRFSVLIQRARELARDAATMEQAMLNALQSRDRVAYDRLKAQQDLETSSATVRLRVIQRQEARDRVILAELQRGRAQIEADEYTRLIQRDISRLELLSLELLGAAALLEGSAATGYLMSGISRAYSISSYLDWWAGAGELFAQAQSGFAQMLSTTAQVTSTLASYERRREEWRLRQSLAFQDVRIGQQQIQIENDHVRIADQEHAISTLQLDHATAMVDFIENKQFGSYDLYDWMSNVLSGNYRYLLQQATSLALLAEQQLAFERQSIPNVHIERDYWQPPTRPGTTGNNADNLYGLTGAERLQRDIIALEQYAFRTDERKLQLAETISLCLVDPFAFQSFRESGVLHFETPMELFDRRFPGHYLRLIKRVRITLIGLIPPGYGIRATLSTVGVSRVVVGPDSFELIEIQRGPETVAYTTAANASGLFELDPQPEMLIPFEGIGVDSAWQFSLPKPANPFDYNTIMDLMITIEYTALSSYPYQRTVIERLGRTISADRAFSLRANFPDPWYDLHNPELLDAAQQMIVSFDTTERDFPANLEPQSLIIQNVMLYFLRSERLQTEITLDSFTFTPEATGNPLGSRASTTNGIISTRRNAPAAWGNIIGQSPFGRWTLALPNTDAVKQLFKDGMIREIILVVTYQGQTPAWPV